MIKKENNYYVFYFDDEIPNHVISELLTDSEQRIVRLLHMFNISNSVYEGKTKYFVRVGNESSGKYRSKLIICSINIETYNKKLFIHEEMHDFTYRFFGMNSCFLFEGVAEYFQEFLNNESTEVESFISKEYDDEHLVAFLDKNNVKELMSIVESKEFSYYAYQAYKVRAYLIAKDFVGYVMDHNGINELSGILATNNLLNNKELDTIIEEWLKIIKVKSGGFQDDKICSGDDRRPPARD